MSENLDDFIKIMKKSGVNIYTATDEDLPSNIKSWIDTGSYSLNALISGSIYGGLADNKRISFAAESAQGKTFLALELAENFIKEDEENHICFIIDTEGTIDKNKDLIPRGLDNNKVIVTILSEVDKMATTLLNFADYVLEKRQKNPKFKAIVILDSIGNVSSRKEIKDISEGNEVADMTRPKRLKAMFRTITIPFTEARIPMIVNNHVYDNIGGYGNSQQISGGKGSRYIADTIIFMSKAQDKDGSDKGNKEAITGSIMTCKLEKSRFTREKQKCKIRISHSTGLDRYYGLIEIAEQLNLIKKEGKKYLFENGEIAFEKTVIKNPEKYFTKSLLDKIDKGCPALFGYGQGSDNVMGEDDDIDDELDSEN